MSPIKTAKRNDLVHTGSETHRLLPETFIHIAGIGPKTEHRLWRSGVSDWDALRSTKFALRAGVVEALDASTEALESEDIDYFFSALPARERWRAFADFGEHFAAVDIETTGMSIYDRITVIGIEHDGRYETFIRGSNLEDAADVIASAPGLITFNGALFDLPFIERTFPGISLPGAHVDLRFLSRRVGWAGSLKVVERLADLKRAEELEDMSGYGATVLWSQFEHGDLDALQQLVLYNAADTCVLRPLAELVTDRLRDDLDAAREAVDPDEEATLFAFARRPRPKRVWPDILEPLPEIKRTSRSLQVGTIKVRLPPRQTVRPSITLDALQQRMDDPRARIVGIDLTGSAERPTGWALLQDDLVVTGTLGTTEEILAATLACQPRIVSIDSPLSIPVGRHCTDDSCECRAVGGIIRACERELKRRGVNVYPCLIQSMQALTRRGMQIAAALRAQGVEVIESYPGAAQDIMRIPRKRASQEQLRAGLVHFGLRGIRPAEQVVHDELDAITSAAVGAFYLAGLYEGVGSEEEGYLIIPRLPEELPITADIEKPEHRAEPVFVIAGEGALSWAASSKRPWVERMEDLADEPHKLLVLDNRKAYLDAVATFGPRARGFLVSSPGERLSRRPSLFDAQRRVDDGDVAEAVTLWLRSGRALCR